MLKLDLDPDDRTLRQFGFIAVAGFGLLAAAAWLEWLIFSGGLGSWRTPVALSLMCVGMLAGACSWIAPRANRPLYLALTLLTFPIGFVVSHVVLAVLFFGLFVPIGLALRCFGRDPLERERDTGRASYWIDARPMRAPDDYFKQF